MKKDKQKRLLTILRGISGSGKSSYCCAHYPESIVCSADHFFYQEDGTYNFRIKMLGKAHRLCKEKCKAAMEQEERSIVIDNTNTKLGEMSSYLKMAEEFDYKVEIIRLECSIETAVKRNTKGISEDIIRRMKARLVDMPGEKIINTEG